MSYLDAFIAVLLIYAAVRGFMSGFVVQIAGFVGFLLGIYVALHFSDLFASKLVDNYGMQQTSYLPLISFSILFIAVLIGVFFLGKAIKTFMKITMLSPLDKIGGVTMSVLKYVLMFGVAFNFINNSQPSIDIIPEETIEESVLYQPVCSISNQIMPYISEGITFLQTDKVVEEKEESE